HCRLLSLWNHQLLLHVQYCSYGVGDNLVTTLIEVLKYCNDQDGCTSAYPKVATLNFQYDDLHIDIIPSQRRKRVCHYFVVAVQPSLSPSQSYPSRQVDVPFPDQHSEPNRPHFSLHRLLA